MFGAFIIACGTGHSMDIWTLWHPTYWLSGIVRALTALISVVTALELIPIIPKVLALPSPAQLEAANQELEQALHQLKETQSQLIETEIKLATTETLKQSEERFRSLLQNASNIIATLKADGQVDYISPSITHILGYQSEDWSTENISNLVHPSDRLSANELIQRTLHNPDLDAKSEFRLQHIDDSWRDFEAIAKNLLGEPNVSGIVITCRDITERKKAESDIRQALEKERELSELKSRFISMASHEFRTPLSVISSSIGILEDYSCQLKEEQKRKQFQSVQKSVQHITQLLDDVLTMNRAEAGKLMFNPEPINLSEFYIRLVEETKLSAPSHCLDISITNNQENITSCFPQMDRKLLRQIMTNLLSNAIKYSPEGSTISTNLEYQSDIVHFQVHDCGIGIPDEDQNRVFESFHRGKNVGTIPGTGLGLSIVKKCVDLHNGQIIMQSQKDIGTKFTVILPLSQTNDVCEQNEEPAQPVTSSMMVLNVTGLSTGQKPEE